ncbi:hypothetical protein [Pseudomonas sp. D1-1]|uniref:hypothetical protein n=1 Tax=Pseudomonas sp. D1-1 TaxID=1040793 RepID=UPI003DA8A071
MTASHWKITVFILTTTIMSSAIAGPAVNITFTNLGAQNAVYTVTNSNETTTRNNSKPTPTSLVEPNKPNFYKVQSLISPHANYAALRYKIGSKECVYSTTFVATAGPGGSKIPKWKESATPGGGAICTITVQSRDYRTYEWAVQITMK